MTPDTTSHRRWIPSRPAPLLLAALLLLVGAPLAGAATYDMGTFVGKTDADYTPTAEAIGDLSLCYIDDDGSTSYTMAEPLVLAYTATCGEAAIDDRCLICLSDGPPGHEIGVQDAEYGRTLHPATHNVTFVDLAGEGEVSDETPVYLDLFRIDADRVDVGDVRVTGYGDHGPMTVVQAGDADLAFGLSDLGGSQTRLGDTDVVYEAGDGVYLNADKGTIGMSDTMVEDTDIRLNADVVDPDASEVEPVALGAAELTVRGLDVDRSTLSTDERLVPTLTVENTGNTTGAGLVETTLDGQLVDARGSPTLAPGETARLVVTLPVPGTPGNHTLAAGGAVEVVRTIRESSPTKEALSAVQDRLGQLEQEAARLHSATQDEQGTRVAGGGQPEHASTPGLGPAVAMVTLLGLAMLLRRR